MAAPNIINIANVTAKTTTVVIANTTGSFSVLSNAAASGQAYKLNTLLITNYAAAAANVALNYYSAAALGGTATPLANNITIPVGSTLVLLDKASSIYLEEDKSIGATATTGNTLSVIVSYEILA
jgi:hypothetical protein